MSAQTATTGVPGTWGQSNPPPQRLEINTLINDKVAFSIYVQAMARFQAQDQDNFVSYYGIAGIHGLPYVAWQGSGSKDPASPQSGYCVHGSTLFPTWHRPYVALFEQKLHEHAQDIAANLGDEWKAAAKNLRAPYWDWAQHLTPPNEVFTQTNVSILQPDGSNISVRNPLYSYHFATRESSFANRDETFRRPSGFNTAHARQITKQIYDLFTKVNDWFGFATDAVDGISIASSLESIHGDIHGSVGGYMGAVPYAAFDPIFWMHHCNVDRIFALWQVLHPDQWVTSSSAGSLGTFTIAPNSEVDADTPLTPFYDSADTESYWASSAIKSTSTFGYTYPELANLSSPNPRAELLNVITNLYGGRVVRNFAKEAAVLNRNPPGPDAGSAGSATSRTIAAPAALKAAGVQAAGIDIAKTAPKVAKLMDTHHIAADNMHMALGALAPGITSIQSFFAAPPAAIAAQVKQKVMAAPAEEDTGLQDWSARVRVEKHCLNETFQVCLFLVPEGIDNSTISEGDCKKWYDSDYFVGQFTAFVNGTHQKMCSNCVVQAEKHVVIEGHIPLDEAIIEISGLKSFEDSVVHPYLQKNLVWRVKKADDEVVPLAKIPSLEVSVWSTSLKFDPRNTEAILPDWTIPHCHKGITAGQPGGCKEKTHDYSALAAAAA